MLRDNATHNLTQKKIDKAWEATEHVWTHMDHYTKAINSTPNPSTDTNSDGPSHLTAYDSYRALPDQSFFGTFYGENHAQQQESPVKQLAVFFYYHMESLFTGSVTGDLRPLETSRFLTRSFKVEFFTQLKYFHQKINNKYDFSGNEIQTAFKLCLQWNALNLLRQEAFFHEAYKTASDQGPLFGHGDILNTLNINTANALTLVRNLDPKGTFQRELNRLKNDLLNLENTTFKFPDITTYKQLRLNPQAMQDAIYTAVMTKLAQRLRIGIAAYAQDLSQTVARHDIDGLKGMIEHVRLTAIVKSLKQLGCPINKEGQRQLLNTISYYILLNQGQQDHVLGKQKNKRQLLLQLNRFLRHLDQEKLVDELPLDEGFIPPNAPVTLTIRTTNGHGQLSCHFGDSEDHVSIQPSSPKRKDKGENVSLFKARQQAQPRDREMTEMSSALNHSGTFGSPEQSRDDMKSSTSSAHTTSEEGSDDSTKPSRPPSPRSTDSE